MDDHRNKKPNPYSRQQNVARPATDRPTAAPTPQPSPAPIQPTAPAPTPVAAPAPEPKPAPTVAAPAAPTPATAPSIPAQQNANPVAADDFLNEELTDNFFEQPEPTPQAQARTPTQTQPTPEAQPPAATPESTLQAPQPQQTTAQVLNDESKKNNLTALALALVGLMLIGAISGGGWFFHNKQVASLRAELDDSKQESASLKSSLITEGGSTTILGGSGEDDEQVAGASTTSESDAIYNGNTGAKDKNMLFEVYFDTGKLPELNKVWISWGGSPANLDNNSKADKNDLEKTDGQISVKIIEIDGSQFSTKSSYVYQVNFEDINGKIHSSGYSVVTIPEGVGTAQENNRSQSQNNQQPANQNPNSQPSNPGAQQTVNPQDFNL